jgi:hypothetical protein
MTLRELIDSDLEIGLEFSFILCPLFDALLSRRKLADSRALVAQLDRASDYGSEGLKFESSRARHSMSTT